MYSTYESGFAGPPVCEARPSDKEKIIILGGGPNRIGQGIEFDYCCCHAAFALSAVGLRDHHGQLQSGDGLDRLRHLRPALFRAAHRRGRAGDRPHRGEERQAQRRDRAVRRPDAAQARASAGECQSADPRHLARRHRPRRGPRPLQGADRAAGHQAAEERHRPLGRGGQDDRRGDRFPGGDPPVLCARRPRHGDRARRGAARPLHRRGRGGLGQEPGADRFLSPRRHRGGRRRACRRQGRVHLRGDGAYRGGRRAFGRLGLLAAAAFAEAAHYRRHGAPDRRARPRAQRGRADERAVRHPERRHLHPRGQSARLAHGAVRRQGDRAARGRHRRRGDGRQAARRLRAEAAQARAYRGEGGGVSRSRASPASIRCSGRRCARPER